MTKESARDRRVKLRVRRQDRRQGSRRAPDKCVDALAGSDIQTNPNATNQAVQRLNKRFTRKVDHEVPTPV